jgi:parallel beta-helix repeat protein
MAAVGIRKKGVRNVTVSNNRSDDLSFLVYVDGDETQTWQHCIVLGSGDVCRNAPNPPPRSTTRIDLPASVARDIDAKGYGYGVLVKNYRRAQDGYRLWEGVDFERRGNSLLFRRPLDSSSEIEIQLFTWNPKVAPADDLKGLVVENNIGRRFRRAAVQINCPVRAYHRRTPGRDCPQEVRIAGNRFDMPFMLDTEQTVSRGAGPINLILWSTDLGRPPWSATGLQPAARAAVAAPDGIAGVVALAPDRALGEHRLQQTVPVKSGGRYVWSLFAKPGPGARGMLYLTDQAGNGVTVRFDGGKTAIAAPMQSGNVAAPRAGVVQQEGGWRRMWVSGTFGGNAVLTAGISFANDNSDSELLVWGPQLEAGAAPFVYIPTAAAPRSSITSQVISINGVTGFSIERNAISSAAGQGIHTEDHASHGSIIGNTIADTGGWGIYLTDSRSIAVTDNVISNSYLGCIALDATADAPRTYSDRYMTNSDITLSGNRCDLQHNPRAWAGFLIAGAHERLRVSGGGNVVRNLDGPGAHGAYVFRGTAACERALGTASDLAPGVPAYVNCGGR